MTYASTLGAYLNSVHPNTPAYAYDDGSGTVTLQGWVDSDGPPPTPEQVTAWQPSPLPAITAALGGREQAASVAITDLKARVALALMQGGMSQADTNAAGSALVVQHSAAIQAFILAGGNVVAGQALLAAIEAEPPAWWSEPIAGIFAAALS